MFRSAGSAPTFIRNSRRAAGLRYHYVILRGSCWTPERRRTIAATVPLQQTHLMRRVELSIVGLVFGPNRPRRVVLIECLALICRHENIHRSITTGSLHHLAGRRGIYGIISLEKRVFPPYVACQNFCDSLYVSLSCAADRCLESWLLMLYLKFGSNLWRTSIMSVQNIFRCFGSFGEADLCTDNK